MAPGSAISCNRAAIFTPSPRRSPSGSTMTSLTWIPTRRRSSPPASSVILSTSIGRTAMIAPGMIGRVLATKDVAGIAIFREGMRNEAIVPGIAHGRIKKAVDDQHTGFLVHLVFYGLTVDRHFDDCVHLLGRISTDRDMVQIHRWLVAWCFAQSR